MKSLVYLEKRTESEAYFEDFDETLFHKQRFITIGYYALYNPSKIDLTADEYSESCEWIYLSQLHDIEMGMDHKEIVQKALLTLREKNLHQTYWYQPVAGKIYSVRTSKTI